MKLVEVENRHRDRRVNADLLREIVAWVLEPGLEIHSYQVGVRLVSARRMAEVNKQYLDHEGSTDVITFNYHEGYGLEAKEGVVGELFISLDDAAKQAAVFGTTWQEEVVRYCAHGILHLIGFDDTTSAKRKIMKGREDQLVRAAREVYDFSKIEA